MNTTESNELIAEFMGWAETSKGFATPHRRSFMKSTRNGTALQTETYFAPYQMKFQTSWDWLIPVVEKIGNRNSGKMGIVTIFGTLRTLIHCYVKDNRVYEIDVLEGTGIGPTYQAVVEFIQWYNENK